MITMITIRRRISRISTKISSAAAAAESEAASSSTAAVVMNVTQLED